MCTAASKEGCNIAAALHYNGVKMRMYLIEVMQMTSPRVRQFLESNFIKDGPKVRNAEFDMTILHELSDEERQQVEAILLSRLNAGHDPRTLLALAEIGTERAVEPLRSYRERILSEASALIRDGLVLNASQVLFQITADAEELVPFAAEIIRSGRVGNARSEAINVLAGLDDPRVDSVLVGALGDALPMVRRRAAAALLERHGLNVEGHPLVDAMLNSKADERDAAIAQLRQLSAGS